MFFKDLISTINDPKEEKDISRISESFKNIRANLMFALAGTKGNSKIILFNITLLLSVLILVLYIDLKRQNTFLADYYICKIVLKALIGSEGISYSLCT